MNSTKKSNLISKERPLQEASAMRERPMRSKQDWKNFHFYYCDDETRGSVTQLLIERDYLLPTEMPNQEKITTEAQFFAISLAERLNTSRGTQRFGINNISDNISRLVAAQDLSTLYFYVCNLYGTVFWRVPYNLQRLPVNPDAFSMYLSVFSDTLIECINNMNTENTEVEQEYEED